jgi:glycosyltransferase involved in cell wall biosynthesis
MKILHVTASMDPKQGGVSEAIRTIIKGLESVGIENSVVSLDNKYQISSESTIHLTALGSKNNPWKYSNLLMQWLREHLQGYQVVIIHGLWLYHGFAVNKVAQTLKEKAGVRVFVMPHGMLDPYFQRAESRKLKALRNTFYWMFVEKNIVNNAEGLLFTCEEESKLARQTFRHYYPKNEFVVGLSVDQPPARTEQMSFALWERCPEIRDQPFLLFLSRIHEKKGVDLLINAYASVFECETDSKQVPKLLIAGPGIDTIYGQQIHHLVSSNPFLHRHIFFPGMLSGEAKWGAFYESETFVLPSHQENFGIAVVEALACGKPVLISDQVNIWREIATSNGGIIANDTIEGTEELLTRWKHLKDSERQEMSVNARRCYEDHFSLKLTTQKLVEKLNLS